ncbi:MAG: hypothetical protein IJL76_02695 [Bacilli bacterium]|nr:hypothetical protein [Bacilli bacterium]
MKYNLAELRCYEKSNMGIDVSDTLSYVFVEEARYIGTKDYQNVFKYETFPLIKKTTYGEHTYYYFEDNIRDVFDEYGETGLCYLLTDVAIENLPIDDLKHIVLYSNYYFKDRKELMDELYEDEFNAQLRRISFEDYTNYQDMIEYLEEKGIDLENGGKKLVR